MATSQLTDAGGRRRIGGSVGRVERIGVQKKRESAMGLWKEITLSLRAAGLIH